MNKSATLFQRAQQSLVGGVNSPARAFRAVGGTPLFVARARGARLWDADGKKYVDYVGSWGPMILGHAHPAVVRAAQGATARGSSFGAPTAGETLLAEAVKEVYPSIEKVRFTSSGTEATMTALRLARGYTGRPLIVKFSGGYHGHSDGLLVAAGSGALTHGHPDSAGVPPETARLTLVLPTNDVAALTRVFAQWGARIAGVILEPVAGNMGVVPPRPEFLRALRALTRSRGSLLIADEVMTGFRLAPGGAQERLGFSADLTCLGKILGGGFPVGALGGPRRIMDKLAPLGPVYQAGTLSGNPVAMAAGLATLKELTKRPPYAALEKTTSQLVAGLRDSARSAGVPVTVNAVGSMFTVFFTALPVTDHASAVRSDRRRYGRFFHGLLRRGIYFPPAQFEAAFVSAAHGPREIELTLKAARSVFQEMGHV
jgi:glutamate-1-semialdehyde 2,1-aminomutase